MGGGGAAPPLFLASANFLKNLFKIDINIRKLGVKLKLYTTYLEIKQNTKKKKQTCAHFYLVIKQ